MKSITFKKIALLCISISFSIFVQSQQHLTKDEQEVQQTVIKFFEALSNRDSIALKNYCAADITLLEYGSTWNVDSLILRAITLNSSVDFRRNNSIDFIRTTVNKNTAWTNYNLHSEITRNSQQSTVQWLETVVAVKEKRRWKIKVLHSTLVKRS